jgi:hypothetical protein
VAVAGMTAVFGFALLAQWRAGNSDAADDRRPAPASASALEASRRRPILSIEPSANAIFTRSFEDEMEMVHLHQGTIVLQVSGESDHVPVIVRTPDGEIIDEGTTFTVSVRQGHTDYVEVEVGRVHVHVGGFEPRSLGAGERYEPYGVQSRKRGAKSVEQMHRKAEPARRDVRRRNGSDAPRTLGDSPRAADALFGQAMRELREERCQEAALSFLTFLERHPDDSRGEDAAFLRVVALTRGGLSSSARAAAQSYLARYPRGLRAREVEALLKQ